MRKFRFLLHTFRLPIPRKVRYIRVLDSCICIPPHNPFRNFPMPQHRRQSGVGLHEARRDQARRPLPDPGHLRPGVTGGPEDVRRLGEPAVDHARGRTGAALQDQRVPGLQGSVAAGRECAALQLGTGNAEMVLREVCVRKRTWFRVN